MIKKEAKTPLHVNEFDDIKKKRLAFVEYVKRRYKKDTEVGTMFLMAFIFSYILFAIYLESWLPHLGIIYLMIGSFLLSKGFIKSSKMIICLSIGGERYSKSLANEYLRDRKNVFIGIILIIFSIIIELLYIWST